MNSLHFSVSALYFFVLIEAQVIEDICSIGFWELHLLRGLVKYRAKRQRGLEVCCSALHLIVNKKSSHADRVTEGNKRTILNQVAISLSRRSELCHSRARHCVLPAK